MASRVPDSGCPEIIDAFSAVPAVIEPRKEARRGRHLLGSPALAIAASALALLASLTTVVWTWVGKGRDRRAQIGLHARWRLAHPEPDDRTWADGDWPENQPAVDDPEHLVRDALAAVRSG